MSNDTETFETPPPDVPPPNSTNYRIGRRDSALAIAGTDERDQIEAESRRAGGCGVVVIFLVFVGLLGSLWALTEVRVPGPGIVALALAGALLGAWVSVYFIGPFSRPPKRNRVLKIDDLGIQSLHIRGGSVEQFRVPSSVAGTPKIEGVGEENRWCAVVPNAESPNTESFPLWESGDRREVESVALAATHALEGDGVKLDEQLDELPEGCKSSLASAVDFGNIEADVLASAGDIGGELLAEIVSDSV